MSLWRHLTRGLSVLTHRRRADNDVADEVEHYLEQATASQIANGLSSQDARRAARLELGSPTSVREEIRTYGWEHTLHTLLTDLHYAARQLIRNPGFALVTTLTLALGIGASTAIFSAVNPILFKPLPYPNAGRLMMIWEMRSDGSSQPVTFGTFYGLEQRARSFDSMAVMKPWQPAITGTLRPERFEGQRVSADYFRTLGISPALGRDFNPADDQFQGPNVVVLSDRLWRLRFAADRSIIGRQVKLDDNLFTVIGVMPGSFENVLAPAAELWAPLQYDPSLPVDSRDWGHHLRMVGRLRSGVSRTQARNELNVILRPFTQIYAKGYEDSGGSPDGTVVNRLQDDLTLAVKPALLAILGAVGLVLLIVCVNVTNLLLASGARRRSEFAMRAALGARRMRMVRQLLTESLLLATIAGTLGIAIAEVGVRAHSRTESSRSTPCRSDPRRWRRIRLCTCDHHHHRPDGGAAACRASVAQRPTERPATKLPNHRRWTPLHAPYLGHLASVTRPGIAGDRGIGATQPGTPVCHRPGLRCLTPAHHAGATDRSPPG